MSVAAQLILFRTPAFGLIVSHGSIDVELHLMSFIAHLVLLSLQPA
jgi:hypothetical protein